MLIAPINSPSLSIGTTRLVRTPGEGDEATTLWVLPIGGVVGDIEDLYVAFRCGKAERAGEAAGLSFPVHVHMLRHSTGYALAARGMDTRRLQHFLGHASITNTVRYTAMSPEPFKDIWR